MMFRPEPRARVAFGERVLSALASLFFAATVLLWSDQIKHVIAVYAVLLGWTP